MPPTLTTSFRIEPADLEAFRRFRQRLQDATPTGFVAARHAFKLAMASANAALDQGRLPTPPPNMQEKKMRPT